MSKLIVTTSWDDGQKKDLKLAELLVKYGIKGTFYLTKSWRDPLEKQGMAEIDTENEIGAHTLNHVNLTAIPLEEARREIEGSKIYLQNLLGHNISMFCYPKGKYNENVKKIVKKSGFTAARTCMYGGFGFPKDPHEWQISLHASNSSPLMTLRIWWESRIPARSLLDWEVRAKLLFDSALEKGGVYHLCGHSWEICEKGEWGKLSRVLDYISNIKGVRYLTNGDVFS